MLKNYFKVAVRNLLKHKFYSLIDIVGLAVSIAAFLLIIQYVKYEWSYDDFHQNAENIYRVESQFFAGEELVNDWATSSYGYATAMKSAFPEIIDFARLRLWDNERVIIYNGNKFREKNIFLADSSFLTMFSYPMVKGNPRNALVEPNTMVVTESGAKKIFGDQDPIGKTLEVNTQTESYVCKITGVLKDVPENSHLNFNYLISWRSISSRWTDIDRFWYQHEAYTYVLLKPGTDVKSLEAKFPALAEKYKTEEAIKELKWGIELVPLTNIHLNSQKGCEREVKGNRMAVWILLIIAIVILIIAWINFINMATARIMGRAKEVGLRKVVGAGRKHLVIQFLLESAIINLIALFSALFLIEIFLSNFREQVAYPQSILFWTNSDFWITLSYIFAAGVVLSGLYPAYMLSSLKPNLVMPGKFSHSSKGNAIRKALVIWQFLTTIILIAGTLIVRQQINFMRTQNLRVDINQTIVIKTPVGSDHTDDKIKAFKEELLKYSDIKTLTASSSIPGKEVSMPLSNKRADDIKSENRLYDMLMTDYDYVNAYQLKLTVGRNFSREISTDIDALILNEHAVKMLEYINPEEAINKEVLLEGSSKRYKVIGVVKDYHHQSLHVGVRPTIIFMSPDYGWISKYYYSIKVSTKNMNRTIEEIRSAWNNIFQLSSFDFFFLDEYFDAQYKNDEQFEKVFSLFTMLAIFIACLGLLGLVSFTTKQKTKEVGIRKVVGASIFNIFIMLVKEFTKWVIIANTIAIPIAYYFINNWLEDFAYHIEIGWWVFVFSGIIALVIALAAISFHAIKAATANPVESLRYE